MNTPFFTVVIPAYNALPYLKRSLSSVLSQDLENYEIIVIDNTSSDGTIDYLKTIDDSRLSWEQTNNQGIIACSRNIGINRAQGTWIAFLDADDEWETDKLSEIYSILSQDSGLDIIVHAEKVMLDGQHIGYNRYGSIEEPAYETLLFGGNQLSPSSTVVRASLLKELGGFSEDRKYITAEDYELWLKLAKGNASFYYCDKPLGVFYRFKGTASSNISIHQQSGNQVFYDHLNAWGEDNNLPEKVIRQFYSCRLLLSYGSSIKSSFRSNNWSAFLVSTVRFISTLIGGMMNGVSFICLMKGNIHLYRKLCVRGG